MNFRMNLFLVLLPVALLPLSGCTAESAGWIDLFNGQNLDGWSVRCLEKDRGKTFWRVDQGTLLCDSIGNPDHDYVWLVTEGEYSDFELSLEFQAFRESPGNSGIQVRSRYDPSPEAPGGGWLDGPQIDIHPPTPWRTGLVYDETRSERRWISPSLPDWNISDSFAPEKWIFRYADEEHGWNNLQIICQGTRIRVLLNGLQATDYEGAGLLDDEAHQRLRVGLSGQIAFQLHSGDELKIRFRDIRIRELNPH